MFWFFTHFLINWTSLPLPHLTNWNHACLEEDGIRTEILYWDIPLGMPWLLCSLLLWSVLYRIFTGTVSGSRIRKARSTEVQWKVQMAIQSCKSVSCPWELKCRRRTTASHHWLAQMRLCVFQVCHLSLWTESLTCEIGSGDYPVTQPSAFTVVV